MTASLSYEEEPIAILDRQVRKLRSKEIVSIKVLWRNQKVEEATWELEDGMRTRYPHLFDPVDDGVEGTTLTLIFLCFSMLGIVLVYFPHDHSRTNNSNRGIL